LTRKSFIYRIQSIIVLTKTKISREKNMTVNVIGLGYIGLPTALSLACEDIKVVGTDINTKVVELLRAGKLPFVETGMEDIFNKAKDFNVEFVTHTVKADIYVIAVPTPFQDKDKRINLTYLKSAIMNILQVCDKGSIIAIESTISPGVIKNVVKPIVEEANFKWEEDIFVAYVPERIIPGNMIYELRHNSRTIGVSNDETGARLTQMYKVFCEGEIIVTSIEVAEMTKIVENTYRDVNIAFANELARMCYIEGIDVHEVIRTSNKHPRVNILNPGPGVGGHCISVDPWFLVGDYPTLTELVFTARRVNDYQPTYVLSRIREIMKENDIADMSKVGLYGLTYKENVDDTRRSPALQIIEFLDSYFTSEIKSFDPILDNTIVANQYTDFESFLGDIKLLVVLSAHDHIIENKHLLNNVIVFDTRNCLDLKDGYRL